MSNSNLRNIVVLNNLPSNLVEEAIIVLKSRKDVKKFELIEKSNFIISKKNKEKSDYVIKEYDLDLILGDSDENRHASEQKTEQEDPERLKEEVRKLRAALHESERAARDARKELASIKAMEAKEHRELADLREVVFNREEA